METAVEYLRTGQEELKKLVQHPLVFIDLGIVSHMAVTVVCAELVSLEDSSLGVKAKFITK